MNNKIQGKFMEELAKLFLKYINKHGKKVTLKDLALSTDLYISTLNQLEAERGHTNTKVILSGCFNSDKSIIRLEI